MFASRHHDVPKIVNLAGRFKCRWARPRGSAWHRRRRGARLQRGPGVVRARAGAKLAGTHGPLAGAPSRAVFAREGTLQRFGADILERLAAEKAIPRRESWGEWVMTEQVGCGSSRRPACRRAGGGSQQGGAGPCCLPPAQPLPALLPAASCRGA